MIYVCTIKRELFLYILVGNKERVMAEQEKMEGTKTPTRQVATGGNTAFLRQFMS